MKIDEMETTGSAVPCGKYQEATATEELARGDDTAEETKTAEEPVRLALRGDVICTTRFRIDIQGEEEKRFFSRLNRALKKYG